MKAKRFILVGGCPFRTYTGTVACITLREVGRCDTKKEADRLVKKHYDECGGLLLFVDTTPELPDNSGIEDFRR